MKIALNNRQRLPLNRPALNRLLRKLARKAQTQDARLAWREISLVLLDDEGIARVDAEFLGRSEPTDVIAFRYHPAPGQPEGLYGEVLVNVERALRVGPRHGGPDRELARYLVHGLLHLLGGEDDTPARRASMRRAENQWLVDCSDLAAPGALLPATAPSGKTP